MVMMMVVVGGVVVRRGRVTVVVGMVS